MTQQSQIHNWTPERINHQKGKTYLITGTNSGAGFAATEYSCAKVHRL